MCLAMLANVLEQLFCSLTAQGLTPQQEPLRTLTISAVMIVSVFFAVPVVCRKQADWVSPN